MRRVRVAEVIEATENGTKKHVLQLMRNVDRERFELELVASDLRDPEGFRRDVDALRAEGFTVHLVAMTRPIHPVDDVRSLIRLVRLFHRRHYDVVHCHSSKAGFLGRLAAFLTGCRGIVYTPHCFSFTAGFGRFVGWFYKSLEFLAGRLTDRLIAVSEHEHQVAVHSGAALPHQVRTVPNGLEDDELRERVPDASLRRELGLPDGAPVVGSIGRLGRQKGYDVFIRAAKLIHDVRPDVHFLLVGKGPYEMMLRRLAETLGLADVFHFTGERGDVLEIFPLIDVFVMSSRWEAMPYALLEAMGAGRAIVVTRVCGLDKVVENGRAGVIIDPEDPGVLRDAVLALLDDDARRAALGREARAIATSRYGLARAIQRIQDIYEEVLHDK
ncbi:MAG TPA: glycosyltransferase family 4 protein [Planctomycetota bacterium]|nr:glycosyltransferase family 4 protein [Planctomycetota bacterium]HUV38866.1 glycosyltransferase family 4 protein [Planctomycetota bacterium]